MSKVEEKVYVRTIAHTYSGTVVRPFDGADLELADARLLDGTFVDERLIIPKALVLAVANTPELLYPPEGF
jgi:hypothetical protein